MVEFEENSRVMPTVSAYYQAIVDLRFGEMAVAASTRRLTKMFRETAISIE